MVRKSYRLRYEPKNLVSGNVFPEINEGNYYIFLCWTMIVIITFSIKIDNIKRDYTSFAHADSSPVKATSIRLRTHGLKWKPDLLSKWLSFWFGYTFAIQKAVPSEAQGASDFCNSTVGSTQIDQPFQVNQPSNTLIRFSPLISWNWVIVDFYGLS